MVQGMDGHGLTVLGFTHGLFVLAKRGVDNAHVEQDLGGIGDLLEVLQCIVILIVVIPRECGDPGLYFLLRLVSKRQPRL